MRRLWLPADWSGTFRKHANQKRGLICNFFFWIFFKVWNSGGVQPSAAASSSAVDTAIRGEDISFTQASGMEVSTRRAPLGVEIWADPALIASRMVCTVVKAADKTSLRANRAAKAMLRYFYPTERPRLHRHESANARSKQRVSGSDFSFSESKGKLFHVKPQNTWLEPLLLSGWHWANEKAFWSIETNFRIPFDTRLIETDGKLALLQSVKLPKKIINKSPNMVD